MLTKMQLEVEIDRSMERLAEHTLDNEIHPDVMIERLRKHILEHALDLDNWNQCHTAKRLGVHRNTLSRWLKDCGIKR